MSYIDVGDTGMLVTLLQYFDIGDIYSLLVPDAYVKK